jgi:radical SAM superfamily enzyme YgiQ (UPF0313 family)
MSIVEPTIRPPAESDSFLLQVTLGCSSYECAFCAAYGAKKFAVKPQDEVFADIERAARCDPGIRRVFLLDGDALALNNARLVPILRKLRDTFPALTRVSSYANGYNITARSDDELKELYDNGLTLMYMGLESGSRRVLDMVKKRSRADEMVEAVRRAARFDIKASVIVLLGLGGVKMSREHVRETIDALNRMQPRYLSFLSLMLISGTPLYRAAEVGEFEQLDSRQLLAEAHDILSGLELEKTVFRSNHASNYLALEGRLPKDKGRLLAVLQIALETGTGLRPEFLRGL